MSFLTIFNLLILIHYASCLYRLSTVTYLNLGDKEESGVVNALLDRKWSPEFTFESFDHAHVYFDIGDPALITNALVDVGKECAKVSKITFSFSRRINGHYTDEKTIICENPVTKLSEKINVKSRFVKMEIFRREGTDIATNIESIAFYTKFDRRQIFIEYYEHQGKGYRVTLEKPTKMKMMYIEPESSELEKTIQVLLELEDNKALNVTAFLIDEYFYRITLPEEKTVVYIEGDKDVLKKSKYFFYEKMPSVELEGYYKFTQSKPIDLGDKKSIRKVSLYTKKDKEYVRQEKSSTGYEFLIKHVVNSKNSEPIEVWYNENNTELETFFPARYLWLFTTDIDETIYAKIEVKPKTKCEIDSKTEKLFPNAVFEKSLFVMNEIVSFHCSGNRNDLWENENKKVLCGKMTNSNLGVFVYEGGEMVEPNMIC